MQWKAILCLILPIAAFVGTWAGIEAGGGYFSGNRVGWLVLLACCIVTGFIVYFSSERSRMNRTQEYR